MSSWNPRANEVFLKALEMRAVEEHGKYLDEATGGDTALRAEVEALLEASARAGRFLEDPASELPRALGEAGKAATGGQERAGTQIGPYQLIEQIGEGGFGVVFMAEQVQPIRRTVALKIVKPGMDTRQVVARFEAERQALALMEHPNIARVIDGGAAPSGRPYFVMELVKGVPITRYCDEQQLTPRERLALFVPVCQAVQHAHQKGIIHRDLKPSNVLIAAYDDKPVPKVIDFGVAKALGQQLTEQTLVTGFGNIIGTLEYMSPEQAEFNAKDVDTRADIYSLGVLLYEILTGSTPLTKERMKLAAMTEALRLIREEEPPNPSTRLSDSKESLASISAQRKLEPARLTKEVRGDLDWIVMKCLEKDRTRRYEAANGLARDIERYLSDEPVEAGPPSVVYRVRKFTRKYKKTFITAGVVGLLLLASTAVSAWQAVRATMAERQARAAELQAHEHERQAVEERDAKELARQAEAAQRHRADEEAAIAKAVNEFLQNDLLEQADVSTHADRAARNKNITVLELLNRAAREIERKFKGQELTEAEIRLTIGKAYRALGEYAEAEKHIERSRILRLQKLGDHPDTLESMHDLGVLYLWQRRDAEAEATFKRVEEGLRAKRGTEHRGTLRSLTNLGYVYMNQARYDEAEPLFKRALEGQRAKLGPDDPDTLISMNNLADVYRRRGRFDDAESLYKQALAGWRGRGSADHRDALVCMDGLAQLFDDRGTYAEAESLYEQVLNDRRANLGADHPETLSSMNNLAMLYRSQGRSEKAAPLCKLVLEGSRAKLGVDHPDTTGAMNSLAGVYVDLGRHDEAEPLLRQVIQAWRAQLGPNHPDTLISMNNLGMACRALERYDEAEELLKRALDGLRVKLGADHPTTLHIRYNLAGLYMDRGRYADAEPLFKQVFDTGRAKLGPGHPDTLAAMNGLALLHTARGEHEKAEPLARESLAIRVKKEPDLWSTFSTRSVLGGALLGQKKYAEAEPILLQGYQGMKEREAKIPNAGRLALTQGLERLVRLYEAWDKKPEADKWRKTLEEAKAMQKKPIPQK